MSSLCSLPRDLRCYLFEFVLSNKDRRTVTKLNRTCYQDMNEVMYTNMHVPERYLMHDITTQLQHFQHTTKLKIGGLSSDNESNVDTDYLIWNFVLMINSCDRERLKKITFDFWLVPDALRLVSERFYKLEHLKLSYVPIHEYPWEKLSNFHALKRLQVVCGSITTENVKDICKAVPKLEGLDILRSPDAIQHNGYEFLLHIGDLRDLKRLCLEDNFASGHYYEPIGGLEKLEHLEMSSCSVDDTFVANVVGSSPNMKFLSLEYNDVTDQSASFISKLHYLCHLNFSACKISDHALRHVSTITSLRTLILYSCGEITDNGLVHLPNLKHLINLNLNYCSGVSDVGVSYLSLMTSLRKLKLEKCHDLTDDALAHIGKLSFIEKLNLSRNPNFTEDGLKYLVHLRFLHTIYFSMCEGITQEEVDSAGFRDIRITLFTNIFEHRKFCEGREDWK